MRRLALVPAVLLAFSCAVAAQPFATPEALLEAIYTPYIDGNFPENDTELRSAALNDLYEADAENTPEGEMGALDFDPYIDGQDFEIAALEIGEPEIEGELATVEVSFTNFGEPRAITYDLVFENGGWRVDDLYAESPEYSYRLTELFEEAAAE